MPTEAAPSRALRTKRSPFFGRAQLTLVEHALCPLDSSASLTPSYIHETNYLFTDQHRNRRKAQARVAGLQGMSAHDEFYLWGLLALAISQPNPKPDLMATPYYCLRQFGVVSSEKRGARKYELFRAALKRLAGMRYQCDAFFDPIRGEHRAVSFGFLSYSMPVDSESSRAWRFAWDPIFFELAQASGGALSFDVDLYRQFDPATRRLYLYLKKQFWRRDQTGLLDVRSLAVDVIGFSPTLESSHLKRKTARCVQKLADLSIVRLPEGAREAKCVFSKVRKGAYTFRLLRGEAFDPANKSGTLPDLPSPLVEPLQSIGFDQRSIRRIIADYSASLVEQWADITLAAIDRQGPEFFTRSPQAYFIDNVKAASQKRRTPPDWWRELRKRESRKQREQERPRSHIFGENEEDEAFDEYLRTEAREAFEQITLKLVKDLQRAGQVEPEARENAAHMARVHLLHRYRKEYPPARSSDGFQHISRCL